MHHHRMTLPSKLEHSSELASNTDLDIPTDASDIDSISLNRNYKYRLSFGRHHSSLHPVVPLLYTSADRSFVDGSVLRPSWRKHIRPAVKQCLNSAWDQPIHIEGITWLIILLGDLNPLPFLELSICSSYRSCWVRRISTDSSPEYFSPSDESYPSTYVQLLYLRSTHTTK